MSDFNRVFLMGRVGNTPELKQSQQGKPYLTLSLATHSTNPENTEATHWHRVVVFGAQAETCAKYLSKGSQALVEGALEVRTYTDKDGKKATSVSVIAYRVQFISSSAGSAKKESSDDVIAA